MKITYKGDYALKAVLDLAIHYGEEEELVTARDLAGRIDAPVKFFEQVLMELKKGGIIKSKRGNEGGYLLSKSPSQITIGEVVRIIDGPIEPISCVKECYTECVNMDGCVFRNIWQRVYKATTDIIDHITFEDLVSQVNSNQKVVTYSI
jgi:Rrf2 family protein